MTRTLRYALVGLVGTAAGVALLWPFLDDAGRVGLAGAAGLAWSVQVVAFGVLVHFRDRTNRFFAAWAGGTAVRMVLVLLVAWAVVRYPTLPPAPTLLGLAGFFFLLLLLEPVFFGSGSLPAQGAGVKRLDNATMDTA